MNEAYFLTSLTNAINLANSNQINLSKKKLLIITDKISVSNYLKKKNIKNVICLDEKYLGLKRKKSFIKHYKYFDKLLNNLGNKNKIQFKNIYLNSIYNTFACDLPRLYAGVRFLLGALDDLIYKKGLKKVVYFDDFEHLFLKKIFYFKIFEWYFEKKKIEFVSFKKNNFLKKNFLNKQTLFAKLIFIFQEFNFNLLIIKIKKILSTILFFYDKKNIIIEPACDLNYSNFNPANTKFIELNYVLLKKYNLICKTTDNFEKEKFKSLDNIFISYILNINSNLENYLLETKKILEQKINLNKVQKIYWGQSPNYLLRNLVIFLKKNKEIYGVQHGGSYFVTEKDILHRSSDYFFCDKFLSYGSSRNFNKKKYLKNTKLLKIGSLKESYNSEILKKITTNNNKILYIPTILNYFFKPNFQSSQTERLKYQVQICDILNNQKNYKSYIKVLPNSFYKKNKYNYTNLELNPIHLEISKFKNLNINQNTLLTAVKKLKPKIIICDFFTTPVYELSNLNSEIILLIDKTNKPKKDVLKSLKKRCYIISSPNEINSTIKKINSNKINKINNDFYELFYKNKKNYYI
tara:strand:- start:592 stop:2325 length:1734 start_codon:yes stop_codon:yes gene_type:complete